MTMLKTKTIDVIKSTVPVLEVYGEEITKTFYEMLFKNHPELLNIFNHANQRQGKQRKALANAVYAAAVHIEQLEEIIPAIQVIAHKHRALGIKPEHYPIVGQNLLAAIKTVLGDAATDEIIEAWGEAYGRIADVFIQVEAEMYQEAANKEGGWEGFRTFTVERKVKESEVITSFYLKPEDGKGISDYEPGQYITVQVIPKDQHFTHLRHYSLSTAPGRDYYRISVKREPSLNGQPAGIVSNYLHDELNEGDSLKISAPAGEFTLKREGTHPIVLLSGGVGITPMVSMLETILENDPSREVVFIHAAQTGSHHAMKDQINQLTKENKQLRSYVIYEKPAENDVCDKIGYIDLPWIQEMTEKQSEYYFCGPVPFMRAVNQALREWGIPDERIHFEFFGPADQLG